MLPGTIRPIALNNHLSILPQSAAEHRPNAGAHVSAPAKFSPRPRNSLTTIGSGSVPVIFPLPKAARNETSEELRAKNRRRDATLQNPGRNRKNRVGQGISRRRIWLISLNHLTAPARASPLRTTTAKAPPSSARRISAETQMSVERSRIQLR